MKEKQPCQNCIAVHAAFEDVSKSVDCDCACHSTDREGWEKNQRAEFAGLLLAFAEGQLPALDFEDMFIEKLSQLLKEERQRTLKLAIETVEKLRKNRDAQIHGPNDEPVDLGGLEPGYVAMFNEGISAALAALTAIEKDGI